MANRIRKNSIQFYVTDDELTIITERMKELGYKNKSDYLRDLAIDGMTVSVDCTSLRNLCAEMSKIGRNVNQIAHLANGSGNVYRSDIEKIRKCLEDIWLMLRRFLSATT